MSGTSDNSIWSLIWGYNGLGRLDGQMGGPGGAGGPGGGGAGGPFGGQPGLLRLLNESLGGQAGWRSGSRSSPRCCSSSRPACAAPTRAAAGWSPSAARSP
jgi:hypothetical protein